MKPLMKYHHFMNFLNLVTLNVLQEQVLEDKLQNLATHVGPLYEKCAPDAHANQVQCVNILYYFKG